MASRCSVPRGTSADAALHCRTVSRLWRASTRRIRPHPLERRDHRARRVRARRTPEQAEQPLREPRNGLEGSAAGPRLERPGARRHQNASWSSGRASKLLETAMFRLARSSARCSHRLAQKRRLPRLRLDHRQMQPGAARSSGMAGEPPPDPTSTSRADGGWQVSSPLSVAPAGAGRWLRRRRRWTVRLILRFQRASRLVVRGELLARSSGRGTPALAAPLRQAGSASRVRPHPEAYQMRPVARDPEASS